MLYAFHTLERKHLGMESKSLTVTWWSKDHEPGRAASLTVPHELLYLLDQVSQEHGLHQVRLHELMHEGQDSAGGLRALSQCLGRLPHVLTVDPSLIGRGGGRQGVAHTHAGSSTVAGVAIAKSNIKAESGDAYGAEPGSAGDGSGEVEEAD